MVLKLVLTLLLLAQRPSEALTLFIVGDVCPAHRIGMRETSRGFFDAEASAFIRSFDVSVMNFEAAVDHEGARRKDKRFVFLASPDSGKALAEFTAASTANNHIFDAFEPGYEATAAMLDEAGILHTGVFDSPPYVPLRIETENGTLVLLAGTIWGSGSGKYRTPDPRTIVRTLESMPPRERREFRVVYMHGDEEYKELTARQEKWSERFVSSGADAVFWAHSHLYGPVETKGDSLTAYGLGNFLFGGNAAWRTRSGVLGMKVVFSEGETPRWEWIEFDVRDYVVSLAEPR